MRGILLHIAFIVFLFQAFAQKGTSSLSQNSIFIGEKITLTYQITLPSKSNYKFIPENSIIPCYLTSKKGILANSTSNDIEILVPFHDTVIGKQNAREWIGTYEITAWDSGSFILENATIIIDDSTFTLPRIELSAQLVKGKKGQDIYDIRESFAEIPSEPFSLNKFAQNNWWWLFPVLFMLIAYFWYQWLKKKSQKPAVIKELSLKERALLAIDALEKDRLWEKQQLKEHYIELSFIIRSYLSSRYEVNLLEKTTKETKLLLQQKGLHSETIRVIGLILNESDMVKFAKSQPEEIAVLKIAQLARQVIAETSPIEFKNAE